MTLLAQLPQEGLEAWLEEVRPRLCAVLRSYSIPPEDAEDLLQQALLVWVYRSGSVEHPDRWLLGVLRKKCLMYWRGRRRRLDEPMDQETLDWLATPTRPHQERVDQLRDLASLLSRLPPRCQRLIRLRFLHGLEPREVAERMGYKHTSIAKLTSRCLAELAALALALKTPSTSRSLDQIEA